MLWGSLKYAENYYKVKYFCSQIVNYSDYLFDYELAIGYELAILIIKLTKGQF